MHCCIRAVFLDSLNSLDLSRHSCTVLYTNVHYLFCRLVREILQSEAGERMTGGYRIQGEALMALHTAAEAYLVGLLEDANLITLRSCRVTLQPKDIQLACRIRGEQSQSQDSSLARFGVPGAPRSVGYFSGTTRNEDQVYVSMPKI